MPIVQQALNLSRHSIPRYQVTYLLALDAEQC